MHFSKYQKLNHNSKRRFSKTILFGLSFTAITTFFLIPIHAETTRQSNSAVEICSADNVVCIAPDATEYRFFGAPVADVISATALIDEHVSRFAISSGPTGRCKIEAEIVDIEFPGYYEFGSGQINTSAPPGHPYSSVITWLYGAHRFEQIGTSYKLHDYKFANDGRDCVYDQESKHYISRQRKLTCPEGSNALRNGEACVTYVTPPKECAFSNTVGQPCQVSTGAKVRVETDFSTNGFTFTRHYHSQSLSDKGFGKGWHNVYLKRLSSLGAAYYVGDGTGRALESGRDRVISDFQLTRTSDQRIVTHASGQVDTYDTKDRLLKSATPAGEETVYVYTDNEGGKRLQITDHYNKSIIIDYDLQGLITTVTDPSGAVYRYEYDNNRNLTAVIFPDLTPANLSDNPRKTYHYEDPDFPNHLTGITDENNRRHQTYAYNDDGHAISTQKAVTTNSVGQGRFDIQYQD